MSDALVPFNGSGSGLPARMERRVSREIATIQARGSVLAAREVAKIEAITEVTEEALFRGAEVASVASMLIQRIPYAEAELSYIAKAGIAGMADVVLRAGRSFR